MNDTILLFDDIEEHRNYIKAFLENKTGKTVDAQPCIECFDFSNINPPQLIISDIISRDRQLPVYCDVVNFLIEEYEKRECFETDVVDLFEEVFNSHPHLRKLNSYESEFDYETLLRKIHAAESIPAAISSIQKVANLYVEKLKAPVIMITILEWEALVEVFGELKTDDSVCQMLSGVNNVERLIHSFEDDKKECYCYGDFTIVPKVNFNEACRLSFKIEDIIDSRNEVNEDEEFNEWFANVVMDKFDLFNGGTKR
jgi:hypothetical protein